MSVSVSHVLDSMQQELNKQYKERKIRNAISKVVNTFVIISIVVWVISNFNLI